MRSISRKIVFNNLIIITVIVVMVGVIGFSWAENQIKESSEIIFEDKVMHYGNELNGKIQEIEKLALLSEDIIFQNIDFSKRNARNHVQVTYDFNKTLESFIEKHPSLSNMYILFEPSMVEDKNLYYYKERNGYKIHTPSNFSISPEEYEADNCLGWYAELSESKKDRWQSAYYDGAMHKEVISYWHPFFYQGEMVGVVGMDIDLAEIEKIIADMEVYQSGYGILLDQDYKYILHPTLKGENLLSYQGGRYKYLKEDMSKSHFGVSEVEYQEVNKKFGFFNLSNDFKLVLVAPLSEIYKPIWVLLRNYLWSLIAIYTFSIVLNYKSSKSISKPIVEMDYYIKKLEDGKYLLKLPDNLTRYPNEIGSLATTVNRMVEKINRDLEKTLAQNQHLKREMDERKRIQDKLTLMSEVISKSKEGIFITNQNFEVLYINRAFTDISGYEEADVLGKRLRTTLEFNHESLDKEIVGHLIEAGNWSGEIWQKKKNGDKYLQRLTINSIYSDNNLKYIGIFEDETLLERAEQNIDFLKNYDYLTHFPRKNLFLRTLGTNIEIYENKSEFFNVLMIGLDNFRIVNEALGHQIGDVVLKLASEKISEMYPIDKVGRINGDEFAIILESHTYRDVENQIKEINKRFLEPFIIEAKELTITCSIGVSTYPLDGYESEVLLRKAQTAMNYVKNHGKNNFQFYSDKMDGSNKNRLEVASYLRKALEENQFELYYQPIVAIQSLKIQGVEALIRWNHPTRGMIAPDEFIPIAEEMGLIDAIGEWVLAQAIKDIESLRPYKSDLFVAVNIASSQFNNDDFVKGLMAMAKAVDFNLENLELEITERMLMEDIQRANELLHELNLLGVSIAIDDFGTGYSSLSYLKNFKVNKLKIDKIFMDEIKEGNEGRLAKVIVELGHGLGLKVVAEGVETEIQLETLQKLECEYGQGYLMSRPITKSNLIVYLEDEQGKLKTEILL